MGDEIQRAEAIRRNMIADIAHELRTPLTVMQGNLSALLDGVYQLDRGEIATLYDETRVLSRLVDDLRELALADAGRLTLNLSEMDPVPVLEAAVSNFAIAAEEQNIGLKLEAAEHLPRVRADADRFAQIIRNLIVNALRHTAEGSIRVGATMIPTQSGHREMVRIGVADTGDGIAPED